MILIRTSAFRSAKIVESHAKKYALADIERPWRGEQLETGQRANPTVETLVRYAEAVGKRLVVTLSDANIE